MTVTISPANLKLIQGHKDVLGIMKNNGNPTPKRVTTDDVIDFLVSHSPIKKEVEDYMEQSEKLNKKISGMRNELIKKGEVKP